jgi:hypothetical protein
MIPPLFGKQEVGIWRVKKRFPRYGVTIWSLWPNIRFLPSIVAEKNATKNEHISSMCIKINKVGTQEVGIWWVTLPTIWNTNMKLVTKYQICVINSCWEKCDEKCAYMFNVYKNLLCPASFGNLFAEEYSWNQLYNREKSVCSWRFF